MRPSWRAVAVSDIDEAGLAATVDLLKAAGAREVRSDRLDVADRAAVAAYADAVAGQFGRVNVVVNNAGVALAGDVEDLDWSDMEWIMGINFWGVVHGTKEFLPHLIASGDGHVVNMSSLFGLMSMPGQSMYNAAKYAVRGFTEALREEMLMAGHPGPRDRRAPRRHQDRDRPQRALQRPRGRRRERPRSSTRSSPRWSRSGPRRSSWRRASSAGRPRLLVGLDAHVVHHFARLSGSRYQDVVARLAERRRPPKR